jgi:hypothetical protein
MSQLARPTFPIETPLGSSRIRFLVPLLIVLLASTALAKPQHPDYYKFLRKNAAEVLTVRVTSLKFLVSDEEPYFPFVVTARVLSVSRSASGLRRGDVITIGLMTWPSGSISCAAPDPILLPGWKGGIYSEPLTESWFAGQFRSGSPIMRPAASTESYEPTRRSSNRFMIAASTEAELESKRRLFGITDLTP